MNIVFAVHVIGIEAVKSCAATTFDLILMDLQMPNMDGIEATLRIRKMGVKTPIIALTASAYPADIEKSLNVGMNAHITKPVTLKIVRETLVNALPAE